MLRIYQVSLDVVAKVRGVADAIGEFDRDQARQLRRSCISITLNISEGSGVRGGNRRVRYETALGSARETRANVQVAVAVGYLESALDDQLDHIIGTLVKLVRWATGSVTRDTSKLPRLRPKQSDGPAGAGVEHFSSRLPRASRSPTSFCRDG